jgi:hypothetical protein
MTLPGWPNYHPGRLLYFEISVPGGYQFNWSLKKIINNGVNTAGQVGNPLYPFLTWVLNHSGLWYPWFMVTLSLLKHVVIQSMNVAFIQSTLQ